MALFDFIRRKSLKYPSGKYFYTFRGETYVIDFTTGTEIRKAYEECPPLAAVINRVAKCFTNGVYQVVDADGLPAKGSRAKEVNELLKKPNPHQSWGEFLMQCITLKKLYGNAFVYGLIPAGFNKKSTKYLMNLPNHLLDITEKQASLVVEPAVNEYIKSIYFQIGWRRTAVDLQKVLVLNDNNTSFEYQWLSASKLQALKYPVSNCISAYKARNTLITKRGAIGVLSNRSNDSVSHVPFEPKEKEALQQDFQNYGLTSDQWQVIITDKDLQWSQIGWPTRDLMLFEEVADDIRAISDAYEYPFELLGNDKGVTFANKNEAKKMLYQDLIIPEATDLCKSLTSFLMLEQDGLEIGVDFSHLEALQQSEKEVWESEKIQNEALKIELDAGVITIEEWRKIKDYEEL